jgi:hypothetical protein
MADDDRWVSVDEFVQEPVRWFLDVMDGNVVVLTRDGEAFALLQPTLLTRQHIADRAARPSGPARDGSSR